MDNPNCDRLWLTDRVAIPVSEIEVHAIRAQGPGGQNVNKVSNAVHLRFDVGASSLPLELKDRILQLQDQRLSKDGTINIKAQEFRSLEKNRAEALQRLRTMLLPLLVHRKKRVATRPTRSAVKKRLEGKQLRGGVKRQRNKVTDW